MASSYKVVKFTMAPGSPDQKEPVKAGLTYSKALSLRDSLNDHEAENFDPNKLVSYIVEPA
jgi:hypothetical protein